MLVTVNYVTALKCNLCFDSKDIDKLYWFKKEVERPKYRATDVVAEVQKVGFLKFRRNREHVQICKSEGAKK